jgi:hypothetical protein
MYRDKCLHSMLRVQGSATPDIKQQHSRRSSISTLSRIMPSIGSGGNSRREPWAHAAVAAPSLACVGDLAIVGSHSIIRASTMPGYLQNLAMQHAYQNRTLYTSLTLVSLPQRQGSASYLFRRILVDLEIFFWHVIRPPGLEPEITEDFQY